MSDRYLTRRSVAVRSLVMMAVGALVLPIGLAQAADHQLAPDDDVELTSDAVEPASANTAVAPEATDRLVESGGGGEVFVSLDPERFANSKNSMTFDGLFADTGPVAGGTFWKIKIADRGGVPDTAIAAIMNVTATGATANGNVRVYPCTPDVPTVSALNFTPGTTEPNEVIAKLSDTGHVCVYASSTVHVLVDVVGFVDAGSPYTPIEPARYANSKNTKTFDSQYANTGPVAGGTFWKIKIADRGAIPDTATTVVANVTVTGPTANGNLRVYPCTAEVPGASALNYTPGLTRPNELVAKLSDDGYLCVWTKATAHVLVDAVGYIEDTPGYTPIDPTRYAHSSKTTTFDSLFAATGPVAGGTFWKIQIADRGVVPVGATTVVANVTVTNPAANGNLRVYPCTVDIPGASALNYTPGMTRPNELVAKLSDTGHLCIWTKAATDVIVDVVGYVEPTTPKAPIEQVTREPGWHAEPAEVLFTADGQTETVRLVHYGADGLPTGMEPPAGTALTQLDPTYTVVEDSIGVWTIGGASTIGDEAMSIEIPGFDPILLWVASVRTVDGARVIERSELVFPPPTRTSIDELDPFTLTEISERTNEGLDGTTTHFPYVITGPAPDVGTILAGNAIGGRVIEPVGLPSLERGGLTLVTLEVVPIHHVYSEMDLDTDFDALAEADLIPGLDDVVCFGEDGPECDIFVPDEPVGGGLTESLPFGCEGELAAKIGENKIVFEPKVDIDSNVRVQIRPTGGPIGDLIGLQIDFSAAGSLKVGIEGKLQATVAAGIECTIKELSKLRLYVQPPLNAFIEGVVDPEIKFEGEVEVGFFGKLIEYELGLEAGLRATAGIRWTEGAGFTQIENSVEPIWEPVAKFDLLSGDTGPSLPQEAQIEFKPGVFLAANAGVVIGGRVASFIGFLLQREDLGEVKPFELKEGPRIEMGTENRSTVFNSKETGTGISLNLFGSIGLDTDAFANFFKKFADLNIDLALPELQFGVEVGKIMEPPAVGPAVWIINGAPAQIGDKLNVGDELVIRVPTTQPSGIRPIRNEFTGDFFTWELDGDVALADFSNELGWNLDGTTVETTFVMTEAKCDEYRDGRKLRTLGTMADDLIGLIRFPAYLTDVEIKCGALEWDPKEISLSKREPQATATLEHEGLEGTDFEIEEFFAPSLAVNRITADPPSGTFPEGSVEVTFSLECDDEEPEVEEHQWQADPAQEGLSAELIKIFTNCSDDYFDIVEDEVPGGSAVTFDTSGEFDDLWQGDRLTPNEGFLRGRESTSVEEEVLTANTPTDDRIPPPIPPPGCEGGVPGYEPLPELRFSVGATTTHRGSDTVTVIWEARPGKAPIPGSPCPPPPPGPPGGPGGSGGTPGGPGGGGGSASGGADGDPHMTSFDGLRYDSQTVGEYIYAAPLPGAPDAPTVIARHEFTKASSAFNPTSVTALAVLFDGHTVEFYARPAAEVRINGVAVDFGPGNENRTVLIGDGSIRRDAGGNFYFEHPQLALTTSLFYPIAMDVTVTVVADGTYGGLLGIADGNIANDLIIRDLSVPITSWVTYPTVGQFSDESVEVAESWRITDIAESPFGIPYDSFAAESPLGIGSELLEPYRVLALQRLEAVAAMCDGDTTVGSYDIEVFAIELAIGNDPELISCEYQVEGRVVTDAGSPASGVEVTVDAPGLVPCITTTSIDGGFRCNTGVDVDGLDEPGAAIPLTVDVFAAPPGAAGPAGSTTATFTTPAPLAGVVVEYVGDIVIPPASTVSLDLSGTITSLGAPVDEVTSFRLRADSTGGTQLVNRLVSVDPDVNGDYTLALGLPLDTGDVSLTWEIGLTGDPYPSVLFDDLVPGPNAKVFDAGYDPIELIVDGTMTYNGVAPAAADVLVRAERSTGSVYNLRLIATPAGDGSYQVSTLLPVDVANVTLESTLGAGPVVSEPFAVPAAPTMPVTFDVIVDAPVIDVSGVVDDNGAVPNLFNMLIAADTASGPYNGVEQVAPDPVTGAYAFSHQLPSNATAVTLTARIGTVPEDDPVSGPTPVTPGTNPIVFDPVVAAPTLVLTGVSRGGGVPDPALFVVRVQTGSYSDFAFVTPDGAGAWSADFELPVGTTSADITAETGYSASDYSTITAAGLVAGPNPVSFDPDYPATVVQLSGNLSFNGVPQEGLTNLYITAFDATDEIVATRSPFVAASAGAYTETVFLPTSATSIQASARLGVWPNRRPVQTFGSLVPGTNSIVFDDHAVETVLDISGVFTSGSSHIAGPVDLEITSILVEPDGSESNFIQRVAPVASLADGTYSVQVPVPQSARASTLIAELGTSPGSFPTLVVDPLAAGINVVDFSGAVDLSVFIDVVAVITEAGEPVTAPVELHYITRDESNGVVDDDTVIVVPDATGYVAFQIESLNVARSIDIARVVGLPGEPEQFTSFTSLVPGPNLVVYSDDYDPPVVELSGIATRNGEPIGSIDVTWDITDGGLGAVTYTDTLIPDVATGAFDLTRILARGTTTVDLTIESDDQLDGSVMSTEPIAVGSNSITLDLLVGRPDVTLSGVATRNGDPIAGVDVTWEVTDGLDAPATYSDTVTPDPVTGAYSVDRLFAAGTTTVDITLDSGDAGDPLATSTEALVDGANAPVLDLLSQRPVVDLSGILTVGGLPAPGPVQFDFTVRGGQPDETFSLDISPDAGDASYAVTLPVLPYWATDLDVTARVISSRPETWQSTSFSGLAPGTNTLTFDAVADIQVLNISGNITAAGAPLNRQIFIRIFTWDDTGGFIDSPQFEITPDASGDFTFDYLPPELADEVRIDIKLYYIGGGAGATIGHTFTPLLPGANALTVDTDFDYHIVDFDGLITVDGVPISGPVTLEVEAYDNLAGTGAPLVTSVSTGTPDGSGNYVSGFENLPSDIVRVDVGLNLVPDNLQNDEIWQTFEITSGVSRFTFSENYVPLILNLSGTLTHDGVPITDDVLFDVEWRQTFPGGGVFPQNRIETITPDVNGDYAVSLQGPRNADHATVRIRYGVTLEDWQTTLIDPLVAGDNDVVIDLVYVGNYLDISGVIEYLGAPLIGTESFRIYSYDQDVGGNYLGYRFITVDPDDVTGAYSSLGVQIPSASVQTWVVVDLGGPFDTYETFSATVDATPGSTTPIVLNAQTTSIDLSGNVTVAGSPHANETVNLTIAAFDGAVELDPDVLGGTGDITTDASGDYTLQVFLPLDTDRIVVEPFLGDATSTEITSLISPGVNAATVDFSSTALAGNVSFSGMFTVDGLAPGPGEEPTVFVESWDADDYGGGPIEPWNVGSSSATVVYVAPDGSYSASADLEAGTYFAEFVVTFPNASGPDTVYRRTFDVSADSPPYVFTLSIDHSSTRVERTGYTEIVNPDQSGDTYCEYESLEFVPRAIVWAYPTTIGVDGVAVMDTYLLPSGSQFNAFDSFDFVAAVPAGTSFVGFEYQSDLYYWEYAEYAFGQYFTAFSGPVDNAFEYIEAECTGIPNF